MSEASPENFRTAFGLLSHLYLTPALVALIQGHIPDHLDAGPLSASELAKRSGLHKLTLTRALRALTASGGVRRSLAGGLCQQSNLGLLSRPSGRAQERRALLGW